MKFAPFLLSLCLISCCSFPLVAQIPSNIPQNGLVGWWPFNGNANDESGNKHHGTIYGAELCPDRSGKPSSAFKFDGENDYISVDDRFFDNGWSNWTVSLWVELDGRQRGTFMNTIPHRAMGIGSVFAGKYQVAVGSGDTWYSSAWETNEDYQFGRWTSLVVVKAGLKVRFYIDGKLDTVFSFSTPTTSLLCSMYLGQCNCANEQTRGKLDDIAMWNRALSEDEIMNIARPSNCNISITTHPSSDTLAPCSSKSLSIVVTADTTLTYQWQKNDGSKFVNLTDGSQFTGTTTKTLTVLSASKSTEGAYRCVLTTSICSDTTKTATLTVNRVIPSNVPKNDLVGWWPFNCDSQDESGNGHHAESRGAVLSSDRKDIASTAYLFDGRKDHMIVSDSCLDAGWKSYTVSVWARVDSLSVIASGDGSATTIINTDPHTGFSIAAVGNKSFGTAIGDAQKSWSMGALYSETTIQVGKWHHVVVVKDSSTVTMWVDGRRERSVSGVAQLMNSAPCQIVIGKCSCYLYEFFKGKIDDIGLWKRALGEDEIKRIYSDVRCNISITTHPSSDTVVPCSSKSISIVVTADTTLKYQWQKNDGSKFVNLIDGGLYTGTKTRSLTITSASATAEGAYRCVLTTSACSDTSKTATLTVKRALPSNIPNSGLVGWWPFDCTADDHSGNKNHGVVSGAASSADRNGASSRAYSFDGVDDYIAVDWSASLDEVDRRNTFTFTAWLKDGRRDVFPLVNMLHPVRDEVGWELFNWGASFNWYVEPMYCVLNGRGGCLANVPVGEWRHVAFAYDGETKRYRLYINGALTCTDTSTVDIPATSGGRLHFGFGPMGTDQYGLGSLDEIGLWSRALSEDEIKRVYGDACSGGQRKYPLDSMRLSGVASYKESAITLTPSATFQAGSAWLPMKFDASRGFDVRFRFRMRDGSDNGLVDQGPQGADGVVFVMQNTSSVVTGSAGDGIGYHGVPSGLAVEFDSYMNPAFSDPSTSHIAVQVGNGQIIRPWHVAPFLRGIVSTGVPEFMANGTIYNARIVLQGQRLQVYCDTTGELKTPLLTVDSIDIRSILNLGADGSTYMGFTSATGFAQETHELLELSFQDCDQLVSVDERTESTSPLAGRIIPVPARGEARLEFSTPTQHETVCRIYDLRGIERAATTVPAGQTSWSLPLSNLTMGTYRVQVQLEGTVVVLPMLVAP